ncbi:hypothetical protein C8J56DRAFT_993639 [Mycena floridula]|nr:hypothetical protein C8J56DRAFT_993639 [Mycena floridula]
MVRVSWLLPSLDTVLRVFLFYISFVSWSVLTGQGFQPISRILIHCWSNPLSLLSRAFMGPPASTETCIFMVEIRLIVPPFPSYFRLQRFKNAEWTG